MVSVTLKNVPPDLLDGLRSRARRDRRSLNSELIHLLEQVLADEWASGRREAAAGPPGHRAEEQARAWSRLAGRWESDRSVAEEIRSILARRSTGRGVDL